MKDIKTLYLTAKSSGKQADISAYTEAIQDIIDNDPNSYVAQLEYIISSDIGLQTVKPFIEKNGFPIVCYDKMMECLTECIRKCEVYKKDDSLYTEMVSYFEKFRKDHINCFMMFENYRIENDIDHRYVEAYYSKNKNGISNRKLIAGMINLFGEAAIPDALITADSIGDSAVKTVLEFISNKYDENAETIYEWMVTVCNDISSINESSDIINTFKENSLSAIVNNVRSKEHQLYRESMIMDRNDLVMEYSEKDIECINNLITFKEYQMTWADELLENASDINSNIYDLYEMLDGIIEEDVADSVIAMLPNANNTSTINKNMDESSWVVNTRNKKTGEIPGYLNDNHDLGYGEDQSSKKKSSSFDDDEPKLDDYRRPSATPSDNNEDKGTVLNLPSAYNIDDDKSSGSTTSDNDHKVVNNNYYYTYMNSLNKNTNTNSFNDDHSKDDHSKDDHTHIGSHNKSTVLKDKEVPDQSIENEINKHEESTNPWELNIFNPVESFVEAVGDADFNKPESDHPIKDTLMDIDRKSVKVQQEVKKKVQNVQNAARAATKPIKRADAWITNMVNKWKDADENNIKEKMADPHSRKNIFTAIKSAIVGGSLIKAGILLNPVFLFLSLTKGIGKNKREFRIRNEMIGELKTELAIIDEKIKDANEMRDNANKYKLMRLKNEINKKLIRVGGTKDIAKMI